MQCWLAGNKNSGREIFICPELGPVEGGDALYEDAGDGYDYERGALALVNFSWNDARGELTISERQGNFPELVREREYKVIFVSSRGRLG